MTTIDLRLQQVTVEELLRSANDGAVRITNSDGHEFILEPADALEREAAELGQSASFMAFLAERAAEPGRIPLADVAAELAEVDPRPSGCSEEGR
jgi:hypothetical protein